MQAHFRWLHAIWKPVTTEKKRCVKNMKKNTNLQLRITRLRKYPIDPKAYLGRWRHVDNWLKLLIESQQHVYLTSQILDPGLAQYIVRAEDPCRRKQAPYWPSLKDDKNSCVINIITLYLGLNKRQPVFRVSNQVGFKPASSATETS